MQLVSLAPGLPAASWTWVTFDTPDAKRLLAGRSIVYAYHPTNRNVLNLLRNAWLAFRVVRAQRPRVVVTTGAGVAVPFCWISKLFGARIIYVESLARISNVSLTARLVHPVADELFVQWPSLAGRLRKAVYCGSIFSQFTESS